LSLSGFSSRAIAEKLTISFETVRAHKKHIYSKLGIGSQSELFALFYEPGSHSFADGSEGDATTPAGHR